MAYGILVHDAAVYADDPSRDDRLRAELFQKAAQGYQCDVRLPDDDVHEESGSWPTVSAGGTGSSAA